ncbi:MAG: hypothetical protein E2604_06970 [Flavobacterium sp.]|nr:hypothetical protein [Flavobacterium sp.]
MRNYFISIIFFTFFGTNALFAQTNINTEFYKVDLPKGSDFKVFAQSREETANIDVYEFTLDKKPKYLLYLLSNKLNEGHSPIVEENLDSYLSDLGNDIKVVSVEQLKGILKVIIKYHNNDYLTSIIYLSETGNILNRFVFIFPNEQTRDLFHEEIQSIALKNITCNKTGW